MFVWQIIHERLLTKARLAKWQLGDSYCDQCGNFKETILHLLRDCPLTVNVWNHLIEVKNRVAFFLASYKDWIELNFGEHIGHRKSVKWDTT